MLPGDGISMGAESRPPSSADEADLGEVADVEGAVDVEDGIDSAIDGPPNFGVLHAGFRQRHSSSTSYFFFKAFLQALLLRTRSRSAEGGNGESLSIHEASLARSQIKSSLLPSTSNVSTASHISTGSNFLMRPFTLSTGMSTDSSTGDSTNSVGGPTSMFTMEPIETGMTGATREGFKTLPRMVTSSEPGKRSVTEATSFSRPGSVSAVRSNL